MIYFEFDTNGQRSYPIPQKVHDKIGRVIQEWFADEGIKMVKKEPLMIFVRGDCMIEEWPNEHS